MSNTNINYPHPLLNESNYDYVNCSFNIELLDESYFVDNNVNAKISYYLDSNGLKDMIQNDKASVKLYFECAETQYRKIETFDKNKNEIEININKDLVNKYLEIRGYIVSLEDTNEFNLPEHNKELFGTGPYSKIRKGDLLAISNDFIKIPLENYDPLVDRKSILSIRHKPDMEEDIRIDLFDHPKGKISIFLNTEMHELYQQLNEAPENRTILASLFALPAIVEALFVMKNTDNKDDFIDKKWYQVIMDRLDKLQIDLETQDSMVDVANRILPHVFMNTAKSFKDLLDELRGD